MYVMHGEVWIRGLALDGVYMCWRSLWAEVLFFFFQAEDGIRDLTVTGVQTCALPISLSLAGMALAASLFTALPAMAQNATPKVQIKTSMGDIVLELNEAKAPKTVANLDRKSVV